MKRGETVQQILPAPFTGKVTHFSVDQENGDKLVHVQADDGQARFFKEEDLQVISSDEPEQPQQEG